MVHVGQNMFNFVFTTLAWFLASQFYSLYSPPNNSLPRQLRALTLTEAADEVLERSGTTRRGEEYEAVGPAAADGH